MSCSLYPADAYSMSSNFGWSLGGASLGKGTPAEERLLPGDEFDDRLVEPCEAFLTLEDIRNQINSCSTCGVSWREDHVSLDCRECGGYPLSRPCPVCDGKCSNQWRRDLSMSHSVGKAHWNGSCELSSSPENSSDLNSSSSDDLESFSGDMTTSQVTTSTQRRVW